jgi:hypothetical protein
MLSFVNQFLEDSISIQTAKLVRLAKYAVSSPLAAFFQISELPSLFAG